MHETARSSEPLLFDIETCAIPGLAELLPEPTPPRNYRDPIKIRDYLRDARARQIEKTGLDPDLGRIVAIGFVQPGVHDGLKVLLARTEADEKAAIQAFWDAARIEGGGLRTVCGWNVVGFDLPYLLKRSLFLGVKPPRFELTKYRHPQVLDLMQVWSVEGLLGSKPLDFVCRRLGIDVTDVGTGKDVGRWVTGGRWDNVRKHCENDVLRLWGVSHRLGYVSLEPPSVPTEMPGTSSRVSAAEPRAARSVAARKSPSADLSPEKAPQVREAPRDHYLLALDDLCASYGEDREEGLEEILDAAAEGSAEAQFVASLLYEEGMAVPQDEAKSVAWCQKSAAQDYPDAQLQMGLLRGSGRGVPKDLVDAYRWLSLVVENPRSSGLIKEHARGSLQHLEWRLSEEQLIKAKELVESQLGENPQA